MAKASVKKAPIKAAAKKKGGKKKPAAPVAPKAAKGKAGY